MKGMKDESLRSQALLETDLLKTFLTIAETGSFSRTATLVFRTPSAVSMQIKRLETLLDRALFRREGRNVELTADGEMLVGYARRLIKLNEETVARFLAPPVEGRVRFGAPDDFGTRFLPQILSRFASTHPQVEVDVDLAPSRQLIKRQDQGKVDLILMTADQDIPHTDFTEPVYSEPLVWVGRQGGQAHERDPVPLALSSLGCAWRAVATRALDAVGKRYRIAYNSEHSQGQVAAIVADLAVAPLPVSRVAPPLTRLGPQNGFPKLADYTILLRRRPDLGAAATALAGHVVDSFAAERSKDIAGISGPETSG
ncbi:LysR substrate-binding domain-containing protein [Mangrovitalea sediminis]|uniref:LysR substrate-binding domain-containing protein n=1 Tax=Mangrovitalea sediminis TaxID=1982043 RepID=UPI001D0D359A|nr:LysR substrate-binding domain-containing protein [Mangrovitalea sediminis]